MSKQLPDTGHIREWLMGGRADPLHPGALELDGLVAVILGLIMASDHPGDVRAMIEGGARAYSEVLARYENVPPGAA